MESETDFPPDWLRYESTTPLRALSAVVSGQMTVAPLSVTNQNKRHKNLKLINECAKTL